MAFQLGNPLLEFSTDLNSEGDFYWSHGLISNPTYELLSAVCNTSQLWRERIRNSLSASCSKVSDQLNAEIPNAIDPYDVTANVCLSFGASLLGVQNNPLTPRFRLFSSAESLQEALSQQVSSLRDNNSSQDITFFSLDLLLDFSSPYAESSREH